MVIRESHPEELKFLKTSLKLLRIVHVILFKLELILEGGILKLNEFREGVVKRQKVSIVWRSSELSKFLVCFMVIHWQKQSIYSIARSPFA